MKESLRNLQPGIEADVKLCKQNMSITKCYNCMSRNRDSMPICFTLKGTVCRLTGGRPTISFLQY